MIDFDEEVAKFQPSMDIDRVEDNIADEKLRDVTDIVLGLAKNMQEMQDQQISQKIQSIRSYLGNTDIK